MNLRTRALGASTLAVLVGALVAAAEASAVIYWTNTGNAGIGTSIGRANLDGTGVTDPFLTSPDAPCGVAVDDEYIYWGHRGADGNGGFVARAALDGSAVELDFIQTEPSPCGVAVNDTHVFWANFQNGGPDGNSIGRANLDGTSPNQAFIDNAATNGSVCGVDVDADFVYWGSRQSPGDIGRAPLAGGPPDTDFIDDANYSCDVAVNGSHLYWAEVSELFGTGSIGRANLDGSSPNVNFIPNSSGVETPCGIDVDANHVYWGDLNAFITPGTDALGRAELDGDDVQPDFVATAQPTCGVAVDALATPPVPSNNFRITRVRKDTRKGTATLTVEVPGAGELSLGGKALKRLATNLDAPGEVELRVVPRGKLKRELRKKGRAVARAKVRFNPNAGTPRTKTKRVKLVRRR